VADPPLPLIDATAGIALRAWRADDAPALAAAWADPDVARWATVPGERSLAAAARWIGGAPLRAGTGASVDLVVGPVDGAEVWGEVGVARLRLRADGDERTVWDVGWWVVASQRGRGVARAAVALLAGWASSDGGLTPLVARIAPGHLASEAVATGAGFTRRGPFDPGHDLWVRV
jgi:RimJ/RimL family protein N-acetyltransferase